MKPGGVMGSGGEPTRRKRERRDTRKGQIAGDGEYSCAAKKIKENDGRWCYAAGRKYHDYTLEQIHEWKSMKSSGKKNCQARQRKSEAASAIEGFGIPNNG